MPKSAILIAIATKILEEILIVGGVLFGIVGVWDNVLLPNINSVPATVQNAALAIGINPDNAFIPSPSLFTGNFFYYVGGGLIGAGLSLKYGSPLAAIIVALLAIFLLYQDYQTVQGET